MDLFKLAFPVGAVFKVKLLCLPPGLAEHRGNSGLFIVKARPKFGVILVGYSDLEVCGKRLIDRLTRGFAGGFIPVLQCHNGTWERFRDDLVFNRAEQHVRNRGDKRHQNKDQQRRDQHERAQFAKAQRAGE